MLFISNTLHKTEPTSGEAVFLIKITGRVGKLIKRTTTGKMTFLCFCPIPSNSRMVNSFTGANCCANSLAITGLLGR